LNSGAVTNHEPSTGKESTSPEPRSSRAWETPTIEEVDFASTEAAYAGIGADLGLYHS
jgi:hypothetical protein